MSSQSYQEFLQSKQIFHPDAGIDFPKEKISRKLFQFQRDIVSWALRKGRAAIFADCGMGKTLMQLEWARRLGGEVLFLAPLAVNGQTIWEGHDKLHMTIINARKECEDSKVITNYEMMQHFNENRYKGIVLDESSILKNFDGKFRNLLINKFRCVPYKLACTATPSPNDIMELGNHSEFLGNLSRTEMLSTFFVHDGGDTSKWRLKGHAVKDFWKWVCTWAVMLRKPSDLGYSDEGFILPELRIHEIVVDCDDKAIMENDVTGQVTMFPGDAKTLAERRAARAETVQERAQKIVELANQNPEDQFLVWCNLNKESEAASKALNAVEVTGADTAEYKEENILAFADGKIKRLVSKPSICGMGMNLQSCHRVAFLGLSDSYESYYQAVRRVWRFGQKHPVDCYIVTSSLEGEVVKNIKRKEIEANKMAEEMVANMSEFNKADLKSQKRKGDEYDPQVEMFLPSWLLPPSQDEEWRDIFDGIYQVSNLGNVKRIKQGKGTRGIGKILSRPIDSCGYPNTSICIDGNRFTVRNHILVTKAFLGECPEDKEVNHKDGNKGNPVLSNLEYVTRSENGLHAWRTGLQPERRSKCEVEE